MFPPSGRQALYLLSLPCRVTGVRHREKETEMLKYVIEREIDGVGSLSSEELCGASATSNEALAKLAPGIQWVHSYVTSDRTFCIYLAEDEKLIHEHARLSGFPATRIYEVATMIDPSTAGKRGLSKVA